MAVMFSILHEEPEPLSNLRSEIPIELQNIVSKAMAKDAGDRYNAMTEMLEDLRNLKLQMDIEEYSAPKAWRFDTSKRKLIPAIAAIVAVAAVIVITLNLVSNRETRGLMLSGQPRQVTSGGAWESEPSLSPDGGRIAYASNVSGNRDIYIIDAGGGNPLKLTDDPAADYYPAWFPDGSSLAFVSERGDENNYLEDRPAGRRCDAFAARCHLSRHFTRRRENRVLEARRGDRVPYRSSARSRSHQHYHADRLR